MTKGTKQQGFTLVELAIVLVIIGLIVGGVLVGQDLIKAATIRATVTDIEKYNAAATTFRGKFSGYPGDLISSKATEFGFISAGTNSDGTAGKRDGNGLVEGCAAAQSTYLGCESILFWSDLSKAGLIPTHITTATDTDAAPSTAANSALGLGVIPRTKLRDSALLSVYSSLSRNFFMISTISAAAGDITTAAGLNPLEARGIDEKLDDGAPLTGIVQAIDNIAGINALTPAAPVPVAAGTAGCATGASAAVATYNSSTDTLLNALSCSLSIRASF